MAILELDKIVFNKTIIGIVCEKCGGNLKPDTKMKIVPKLLLRLKLGKAKYRRYECENCKKKYIVL